MQYHAIPCNTTQNNAKQCNNMQYHAIPCNIMQYHAIPCFINICWRSIPLTFHIWGISSDMWKQNWMKIWTTIFVSLEKSARKKATKNTEVFTLWRCGKFLFDECLAAARWEDGKSAWSQVWPALWVKCRWIADLMFDLGCSLLPLFGVKWSGPY